ncbi:uncharacterized protein LOC108468284 [Gossypium arboreum]|uniref:uncharacterized protein LOC108468284 n=1 Tax=Gossypium arboreum TaxID=29729 RepID=UPI0022F15BB8|nr:uncharacterized protein LOC108468284 [Gossypium arboreum]
MSECISVVIYYDGEVHDTENGVVFLSENTTRLVFNQNIDLTELQKRIRPKIFGMTPIKILSIKYRFCASIDPVRYDSFDIKGPRSLEAIVETHLASGSPYLELYVQFASPNNVFATSTSTAVQEEYTTSARDSASGWQNTEASRTISTTSGWQSTSDWGRYETSTRDYLLPTTSTGEGTSFVTNDGGSDDESDVDPPREPGPDGAEVVLFSELEPTPTIPEDVEGDSDEEEEDPRFRAYSPPAHMHNVDLSQDDALEFPDVSHRRCDRTSSSLDSGELEVGKVFSNKDSFLSALKQHSIMDGVNYNVVKSKTDKFEAKCAVKDNTCSWKIMASLRKKTGLWEIKKYKSPHIYVGGTVSLNF